MLRILVLLLAFQLTAMADDPVHEFGSWVGVSMGTPTIIGKTKQVSLRVAGVRYSRTILVRPAMAVRYTLDVIPYARLSDPSESATGKGAAPVGFEMRFRPGARIAPLARFAGGFIYFNNDMPRSGGARFNFTAALGGGVRIGLTRSIAIEADYAYHHLSNGYRAEMNPGFDSNLVLIGFSLRR